MSASSGGGRPFLGVLGDSPRHAALFLDRNFAVLDCSKGAESIGGWTRDDLVGRNLKSDAGWEFVADGTDRAEADLRANLPTHALVRTRRQDGRWIELDVDLTPVPAASRHPAGWLLEMRSAGSQATRQLHESEDRLRAVFSAMAQGVVMQAADGRILTCNPAAESMLGLSRAQMEDRGSLDARWPAVRPDGTPFPGDEHPAMVALRTGRPVSNVLMGLRRPGGRVTWISIDAAPVRQPPSDAACAVVTTFADVTSLQEERQRLAEREAELAAYFRSPAFGVAAIDTQDRFVRVNRRFCDDLGYSEHELIGRTFQSLTHPDDRDLHTTGIGELLQGRRDAYSLDKRYLRKDGTSFWAHVAVSRVVTATGAPLGRLAVIQDISLRKQAEEELRRERDFSTRLLSAMPDGLFVLSGGGRVEYVNPAFERMGLFSAEQLQGRSLDDLTTAEGRRTFADACDAWAAGRATSVEMQLLRRDGTMLDVSASAAPPSEAGGRLIVTVTDITQQKATETWLRELVEENRRVVADLRDTSARLHRQHDFLTAVTEMMADGLVVTNEHHVIQYVNPAAARMLGRTAEEVVGHRSDEFLSEEAGETVLAARDSQARGQGASYDLRISRRDGRMLELRITGVPCRSESGFSGTISVVRDVTNERRAAEALRDSEARFRSLFEHLREEVTVFDVLRDENGRVVDWVGRKANAAAREALDGADVSGKRFSEVFGEAHVRPFIETTEQILAGRAPRHEHYFAPLGRWYSSTAFGIDQGTIVSVAMDITARRKAEEAVEQELARNAQLIAELTDALQQVKTLRGFLPMCSHCRKVRDDSGYWAQLEAYVSSHTDATFSHGICPDCLAKFYPEAADDTTE